MLKIEMTIFPYCKGRTRERCGAARRVCVVVSIDAQLAFSFYQATLHNLLGPTPAEHCVSKYQKCDPTGGMSS